MKWLRILFLCFHVTFLHAQQFTPPKDPLQPPPGPSGYLPIVLVNNSGKPDGKINVIITGKNLEVPGKQVFVYFDSAGVGELREARKTDEKYESLKFSKTLDQFPATGAGPEHQHERVVYVPKINSAVIFISIDKPLNMRVNEPNAIVQPNFTDPDEPDDNFHTVFDIFEFAFVNTTPNISVDATAVSFFSIPLYGFISTPSSNSAKNTGLYQPRDYIFTQAQSFFDGAQEKTRSQWKNLILKKNDSKYLRILAPEKAMSASKPVFDPNYLDNEASYGFNFIENIWTGGASFYRTNPLQIQIPTNNRLYIGKIQGDNSIVFTNGSNVVTLGPPTKTAITTTQKIFGGLPLNNSDNPEGDGVQLSKVFEEAIMVGLVPTTNIVSKEYFLANQGSYYTVNQSLSVLGQTTGPWSNLYSKALHSIGKIYTFAYDEELWPQVLLSSDTLAPNTYLGITIGDLTDLPTTTTNLRASMNPITISQPVTLTATVKNTSSPHAESVALNSTPTGSVTFSIDGTPAETVSLIDGKATFETAPLAIGNHIFGASYSGDANNIASTSAPFTQVVVSSTVNPTTTTLASSVNPAQVGQPVTFITEVTSTTGSPIGSIAFSIDGALAATVSLTNGQARYETSSLSAGSHTIVASYSGDSTHSASVSIPLTQIMTSSKPNTTTSLASSLNPAQLGQSVTFTAQISSTSGTPTGSVAFTIDGDAAATVTLENEQATYQTSILSAGDHLVVANYLGDSSHLPSSASLVETIQKSVIFPPRDLKAKQIENRFAAQADVINRMTWKAPKEGTEPAAYHIYRDRQLTKRVAVIPNLKHLRFNDHNRKKGKRYHYFIVSVDALGQFSAPAHVSVGG